MPRSSLAVLPLLLLAGPLYGDETSRVATRPNILLLIADDLGYGECGFQHGPGTKSVKAGGVGAVPTPHLDALAADGVRFTQGYVTASYCSPSRAGLLTGVLQTRFGHELNPVGPHNEHPLAGLPIGRKTLADHLRGQGYATALIGKWHLGGHPTAHPLRRGFDRFWGFLHEGHTYADPFAGPPVVSFLRRKTLPDGRTDGVWESPDGRLFLHTGAPISEPPYDANNPVLADGTPVTPEGYFTHAMTREAERFLDDAAGRPFFLCASYSAVHSPMQALPEDYAAFAHLDDPQRRVFGGMLKAMDESVGALRASLERRGLSENTLVLFLSDNGGPTAELTSTNLPLRDGKGSLYEGGVRVPMLAAWPGVLPQGTDFEEPVWSLDLTATALAAAGGDVPKEWDGVDLRPWINGPMAGERDPRTFAWRMGPKAAFRYGDLKAVRPSRDSEWELYDLAADPSESRDLAAERPDDLELLVAAVWGKEEAKMVPPRDFKAR
ncbi:sulfatase-like hydrolase/transferase [Alienimonas chondri]|uniref:Arylsulfatase n=1 Tax=Alienimonas chondri TaxID=2681879 RepID=A0ABX1VCT6_9PLAN|nr:sulfatase-like hydrolase/transferase [Alienimonas chondri]NNJ25118.1 Arylsulfatase [Alienimonas chondri]